ncbi:cytochrome P450 [uncultured Sulfitobacter sp.]|uniref:cytochrome P450 n=1 Tax=uncultured Sulfitobacter sp. TaxID=191468 RepID=UPI002614ED76|nr:cytochrome P450 [uncultured Sulfitobacter sp.]
MQFNVVNGREFGWPLVRFLKELPNDYIGTMSKVQARHGDLIHWRLFGGLLNFAFISDGAANRELFVRNTEALGKSPSQIQTFIYAAGQSVATAHGGDWRRKRKEANILFSRNVVEASCSGQVDVTRNYVAGLGAAPQDAITIARRMAALTSSRGILGRAISLGEADTQIAFSQAAADRFNAESAQLFARPNWMLAPWRRELTRRKSDVFPIVQSAIDDLRDTDVPNDGLMNHYVKGDFITSNDDEVLAILVGLLMGAQDNIAAATAWVLAFLAHHPHLQDEIRTEVADIGSEAQDFHNCALLKATISEVLRLRPPAPANQPRVLRKEVNIAGHRLPKGTYIFNSFYNMHHNPAVFTRPEIFAPTRFLDGTLERSTSFAPFGHGPRNCVAQGMAMQQLMAIVVGTLRGHEVITQQKTLPEIEQKPLLVPSPFKVVVRKRGL